MPRRPVGRDIPMLFDAPVPCQAHPCGEWIMLIPVTAKGSSPSGAKLVFFALCLLCLAPLVQLPPEVASAVAPAALIGGAALALTLGNPYSARTKPISKKLLQASVVLLGFSMDIAKVAQAGKDGLIFSLISILAVFGLGWALQRALKVRPVTGLLVSAGTAICGGSAIAAISSVVEAPEEDVSVAVGTVFLLNAVALLIFPPLGHLLGLSQHQFGVWAGIAIHDIASVVGAGTSYGTEALDVATAVKLSRVLYLVPITFITAYFHHRSSAREEAGERKTMQIPWFVGLFLLASAARSLLPIVADHASDIKKVASAGFALSLFFIGTALSRATLKSVGTRPLVLGVLLWLFISVAAFLAVRFG
ncbi:putative sulfate exporter family transporter [soil metagenome]